MGRWLAAAGAAGWNRWSNIRSTLRRSGSVERSIFMRSSAPSRHPRPGRKDRKGRYRCGWHGTPGPADHAGKPFAPGQLRRLQGGTAGFAGQGDLRREVANQAAGLQRPRLVVGDHAAEHIADRLHRLRWRHLDHGLPRPMQVVRVLRDDGRGERFLAFEVVVERTLRHAGMIGDLLDAGGVVAEAREQLAPGLGQAVGDVGLVCGAGHGGNNMTSRLKSNRALPHSSGRPKAFD